VIGFMHGGPRGRLLHNPKDGELVPAGSQLVFVTSLLSHWRDWRPM
jgi:hypothetical protein